MIVYLAAPYSHPEPLVREFRFNAVSLAAAKLIDRGIVVYSPVSHSHPISLTGQIDGSWATWGKQCLALLDVCSHLLVLTLPGWDKSLGLHTEIDFCTVKGIPVLFTHFDGLDRIDFAQLPPLQPRMPDNMIQSINHD
jgi:hypothetical protein